MGAQSQRQIAIYVYTLPRRPLLWQWIYRPRISHIFLDSFIKVTTWRTGQIFDLFFLKFFLHIWDAFMRMNCVVVWRFIFWNQRQINNCNLKRGYKTTESINFRHVVINKQKKSWKKYNISIYSNENHFLMCQRCWSSGATVKTHSIIFTREKSSMGIYIYLLPVLYILCRIQRNHLCVKFD